MPPRHSPPPTVTEQPTSSGHVMTANTADIRTAGHSITGHGQNLQNMPEPSGLGESSLGNLAQGTVGTLNTHISKVGAATKSMGSWLCGCGDRLGSNADRLDGTEQDNRDRFDRIGHPTERSPLLGGGQGGSPSGTHAPTREPSPQHSPTGPRTGSPTGSPAHSPAHSPTRSPSPEPTPQGPSEQQTVQWLHNLRQTDWRTQRGKRNDNLTLTPEMQNVLDHHAQRPDKPVTTTFTHSMNDDSGNDGPLRMNHDMTFHYQGDQDPSKYQYIRFSKATKISNSDIASTEPGYVRYGSNTPLAGGRPVGHDGLNTQLDNGFQHAQWSLDGPREPFSDAAHTGNHDNPGIVGMTKAPFVYPFGMKTEFYGVLYDPDAGQIMNVTHYQGTFTKPSFSSPAQHQSNVL